MTQARSDYELLDDALEGRGVDPSVAEIAKLGSDLRKSLGQRVPPAPGARALFVQGVSARAETRRGPRMLVPSIALGILALVVAGLSRTALPGSALYQVRKVLASVDLAPSAQHEVDLRITRARDELALAQSLLHRQPAEALAAANIALEQLGQAQSFLDDVSSSEATRDRVRISQLERRADSLIAQATAESHSPSGSSGSESTSRSGAGPARSDDSGTGVDRSGDNSGRSSGGSGSQRGSGGSGSTGSSGGSGSNDGSSQGSSTDRSGSNDQGSGSSNSDDQGGSGKQGPDDHPGGHAQPSPSPGAESGNQNGSGDSNGTSDLGTSKGGGDRSDSESTDGTSVGSLDG